MSINSKMTALADEIRVLSGTTEAMGLDTMTEHIGDANTDVAAEASLIEQIASALEGKAGGSGGIPEFSTVRVYPKDIRLSDNYRGWMSMWDDVQLYCYYIDEEYKDKTVILFDNNETDTLDKSEAIFTVPTNSTIILDFEAMENHYIDAIVSSVHNELHDMNNHSSTTADVHYLQANGGRYQSTTGIYFDTIPIWGDTEIRISEFDNE